MYKSKFSMHIYFQSFSQHDGDSIGPANKSIGEQINHNQNVFSYERIMHNTM